MLVRFQNQTILSLFALFAILFLFGCAGKQVNFQTPSGKPEVTINSTNNEKIKSTIVNEFVNRKFTLVNESNYNLVFTKQMTGFRAALYQSLLGNSYSSTPTWEARINIIKLNNKTRLITQPVVKMKNAFGKEDVNDFTNSGAGAELQKMLNKIKSIIENH